MPTKPGQVGTLTFDSVASSNTEIIFSWDLLTTDTEIGLSAITGYTIEQSSDSGATWSTLETISSAVSTYTASGLTPGGTYHHRVSAVNIHGTGDPSAVLIAKAAQVPGQPSAIVTS